MEESHDSWRPHPAGRAGGMSEDNGGTEDSSGGEMEVIRSFWKEVTGFQHSTQSWQIILPLLKKITKHLLTRAAELKKMGDGVR